MPAEAALGTEGADTGDIRRPLACLVYSVDVHEVVGGEPQPPCIATVLVMYEGLMQGKGGSRTCRSG